MTREQIARLFSEQKPGPLGDDWVPNMNPDQFLGPEEFFGWLNTQSATLRLELTVTVAKMLQMGIEIPTAANICYQTVVETQRRALARKTSESRELDRLFGLTEEDSSVFPDDCDSDDDDPRFRTKH